MANEWQELIGSKEPAFMDFKEGTIEDRAVIFMHELYRQHNGNKNAPSYDAFALWMKNMGLLGQFFRYYEGLKPSTQPLPNFAPIATPKGAPTAVRVPQLGQLPTAAPTNQRQPPIISTNGATTYQPAKVPAAPATEKKNLWQRLFGRGEGPVTVSNWVKPRDPMNYEEMWDSPLSALLDLFVTVGFLAYDVFTNLWFVVAARTPVRVDKVLENAQYGDWGITIFITLSELWIALIQRRMRRVKSKKALRDLTLALWAFRILQGVDFYASVKPIVETWGSSGQLLIDIPILVAACALSWYTIVTQSHIFGVVVETWYAIIGARRGTPPQK